jgi:hypothetical protein
MIPPAIFNHTTLDAKTPCLRFRKRYR